MASWASFTMIAVVGLGAAPTSTAVGTAPAFAQAECLTGSNDFDRDGTVAVGMPGPRSGAVQSRRCAAFSEIASFREDSDQDQCSLLVVGAAGRDVEGFGYAGVVLVYRYDAAAQLFALVRELAQGDVNGLPESLQAGARFGAALAAPYHFGSHAGSPGL